MADEIEKEIDLLKNKFEFDYKMPVGIVNDLIKLAQLSRQSHYKNEKIRFTYTDDIYGELARELHNKRPLKRSYDGDAGVDLPVVLTEEEIGEDGYFVYPGERDRLHTGIKMEFPVGYYARIVHRSSTEKARRLRVIEGIIDDYRGEILIQVHNLQNTWPIRVHHGERLGQIILARTAPFAVEYASELRPSQRGDSGFGSSGK